MVIFILVPYNIETKKNIAYQMLFKMVFKYSLYWFLFISNIKHKKSIVRYEMK